MAEIIYKDEDGSLQIGTDSNSEQLAASVYRSRSDKKIVRRYGRFCEVSADGSSRQLFAGGTRSV